MKNSVILNFSSILLLVVFLFACEKENEGNETKISSYGSSESHNNGENCMNCHKSGSDGEGWFTTAGSIYNSSFTAPYMNGTVNLTTEPQNGGITKATIEVDKKGNFYTTTPIDFAGGLYVSITGTTGTTKYMMSKITTGQCYSCHGNSTDDIWAE